MTDQEPDRTPLQAALAEALAAASRPRDQYDKEIQRLTGTSGKPIYDIMRGKSRNPSAETLRLIAQVMGLPEASFFLSAGTIPPATARPFEMEGASRQRMRQDVPIFGTGLGADEIIDGEAIEQTRLNTGDVVGYMKRPVLLDGRTDVYGIYVQGSSMSPRFHDGETVFVERRRPARIGDDVVVYLRVPDEVEGERTSSVLVKTLVRKTANHVELKQYSPALEFRIDGKRVERIDRVIPWSELVA